MTEIKRISSATASRLLEGVVIENLDKKTMDFCLMMSQIIWGIFIDNKLGAIWGVIPPTLMSHQAYLWLYTTPVMTEHQFILVRHSQMVIDEILKEYPTIVGHVVMGSDKSMRWIKWLGARFGEPQGTGIPFKITRESVEALRHG